MSYKKIFKWLLVTLFVVGIITSAFGFINGWPETKEWENDQKIAKELPPVIQALDDELEANKGTVVRIADELKAKKPQMDTLQMETQKLSDQKTSILESIENETNKERERLQKVHQAELDVLSEKITANNDVIEEFNNALKHAENEGLPLEGLKAQMAQMETLQKETQKLSDQMTDILATIEKGANKVKERLLKKHQAELDELSKKIAANTEVISQFNRELNITCKLAESKELPRQELKTMKPDVDTLQQKTQEKVDQIASIVESINKVTSKTTKERLQKERQAELDSLSKKVDDNNALIRQFKSAFELAEKKATLNESEARIASGNASVNTILYSTYAMFVIAIIALFIVIFVITGMNSPMGLGKILLGMLVIGIIIFAAFKLAPGTPLHPDQYYIEKGLDIPAEGDLKMTDTVLYLAYLLVGATAVALITSWVVSALRK